MLFLTMFVMLSVLQISHPCSIDGLAPPNPTFRPTRLPTNSFDSRLTPQKVSTMSPDMCQLCPRAKQKGRRWGTGGSSVALEPTPHFARSNKVLDSWIGPKWRHRSQHVKNFGFCLHITSTC
jgi:hypothetical protein